MKNSKKSVLGYVIILLMVIVAIFGLYLTASSGSKGFDGVVIFKPSVVFEEHPACRRCPKVYKRRETILVYTKEFGTVEAVIPENINEEYRNLLTYRDIYPPAQRKRVCVSLKFKAIPYSSSHRLVIVKAWIEQPSLLRVGGSVF